jgi:hypothetical protein
MPLSLPLLVVCTIGLSVDCVAPIVRSVGGLLWGVGLFHSRLERRIVLMVTRNMYSESEICHLGKKLPNQNDKEKCSLRFAPFSDNAASRTDSGRPLLLQSERPPPCDLYNPNPRPDYAPPSIGLCTLGLFSRETWHYLKIAACSKAAEQAR